MALDREVVVRYRARPDHRILVDNADPRFRAVEFAIGPAIASGAPGDWGNYPRAAAQALYRELGPLHGLEGEVSSTLPVAAGLSSSSALVVAIALALLDANRRAVAPLRLMDLLARGERYVGLQGGGMDQAVCLGGRAGHAIRIDFRPALTLTPILVPPSWRFVVASSGVEATKAAGAREGYNARVRESREALERVARYGLAGEVPADYAALAERLTPDAALALAVEALDGDLLRRFRHVVSEGERVNQAEAALRAGDLEGFGRLLSSSHRSLRDDYDVSSPELEALVRLAEANGAVGARLTGAGFGGSIVALASAERAEALVAVLARRASEAFIALPGPAARVTSDL